VNPRLNSVYPVNTADRIITLLAVTVLLGVLVGPGVYCHVSKTRTITTCFERCGGSAVVEDHGGCTVDQCLCVTPAPEESS
jgi:hypothetical protein